MLLENQCKKWNLWIQHLSQTKVLKRLKKIIISLFYKRINIKVANEIYFSFFYSIITNEKHLFFRTLDKKPIGQSYSSGCFNKTEHYYHTPDGEQIVVTKENLEELKQKYPDYWLDDYIIGSPFTKIMKHMVKELLKD